MQPEKLTAFLIKKMKSPGTAACPLTTSPLSSEGFQPIKPCKAAKLASTKYYDNLPTSENEQGQAFRDIELEKVLLEQSAIGIGAQFGGKYFAHDIRVIRLPRHGVLAR